MTIGTRTAGAWAAGSTSISTNLPTSVAAGDMMILFVGCKPYNATITDVSGWTRLGTQQTNGTTGAGTDTGSVAWSAFYRIFQNGDTAPTVSITTGNTALACIFGFTKTEAAWATPRAYFGADTSSGTDYAATAASSSGQIAAGDYLCSGTILAGNDADLGTPTCSATNATIGTVTQAPATNGTTNTGTDCRAGGYYAPVSAGQSTADAVVGWTLTANQTGGSALVVVRELNRTLTTTVGAAEITGYAPTVTMPVTLAPTVGALAIEGFAPTPVIDSGSEDFPIEPGVGALSVTGYAPALTVVGVNSWASRYSSGNNWFPRFGTGAVGVTQSAGAVEITGYAPTVTVSGAGAVTREPTVGALEITGYAPTLTLEAVRAPAAGAVEITGYAPTLAVNAALAPSAAAVEVTGYAPSVGISHTRAPAVGEVAIEGYAPSPQIRDASSPTFYPAVTPLAVAGDAPTLQFDYVRAPTVGAVAITGYAPLVGQSYARTPAVGALELTGYAPALVKSETRAPAAGALTLTGYAPTPTVEQGDRTFTPATAQLGVEGKTPLPVDGGIRIVTFPFATTAQGFVATPGAGTTMAWTGADGNPAGSLQTATTGKNRVATNVWRLTTDWATLGVPAGKVITGISAKSAQSRVTTWTTGSTSSTAAVTLTPTGEPAVTIAASRSLTGVEASWQSSTASDTTGLEIPSGGSLEITLGSTLRTGNSASANVTLRQDNVTFTVTYTAAKVLRPEGRELAITGYAPTVLATVAVNSWFNRTTGGLNSWFPRNDAGPTEEYFPAVGALALTGYAPTLAFGSPTIRVPATTLGIEGYALAIIGEPVVLLGADWLDSGPATITATDGIRIVQQGDYVETPTVGALALTGYAPSLRFDYRYSPRADLAITGYAPGVTRDYSFAVEAGALALEGYAPTVVFGSPAIDPEVGALEITGYAPRVALSSRLIVEPPVADLAISGYEPTAAISVRTEPTVGALEITGYAPTLENTHRVTVGATSLGIDGYILEINPREISVALASGTASTSASGIIIRNASGTLQSPQPLAFVATGGRIATGSGTLNSGPATLRGNAYPVMGVLESADARLFGRGTVIGYEPPARRLKPVRVNRYTVVLKPNKRTRIKRMNHRKPMK